MPKNSTLFLLQEPLICQWTTCLSKLLFITAWPFLSSSIQKCYKKQTLVIVIALPPSQLQRFLRCYLKDNWHRSCFLLNALFTELAPLGRFSHRVAMSVVVWLCANKMTKITNFASSGPIGLKIGQRCGYPPEITHTKFQLSSLNG